MKVTFQMHRNTGEAEKLFSLTGVDMSNPSHVKEYIKCVLQSAQVLWPEELKGIYIGKTPIKKKANP